LIDPECLKAPRSMGGAAPMLALQAAHDPSQEGHYGHVLGGLACAYENARQGLLKQILPADIRR
jgi:hypothetical protein